MANEMNSFITVINADEKVNEKLKELLTPSEGEYDVNSIEILNRMKGTQYSYSINKEDWSEEKDWPTNEEWDENLGPKWLYIDDFEEGDVEKGYEPQFRIRSAWAVPQPLLSKLSEIIYTIKEDCYLIGTYEDEGYDPVGAFLYAKDWDDIEDLDHSYTFDELWDDDELRDKMWEENENLKDDLDSAYQEYLEEQIEN